MGKDENYDPTLGLGVSVVSELSGSLLNQDGWNCHIIMYNFLTLW